MTALALALLLVAPVRDLAVAPTPHPCLLTWTAPSSNAANQRGDAGSPLIDLCCCEVWYLPRMAHPSPEGISLAEWQQQKTPYLVAEIPAAAGQSLQYRLPSWVSWGAAWVTSRDAVANYSAWSNIVESALP